MRYLTAISLFIIGLGLSACKANKEVFKDDSETKETVDDLFGNLEDEKELPTRPRYNPSAKRINDVTHAKLEVSFDWEKSYLYGTATHTITPHFYPTDSLTLDAKGMEIKTVHLLNDEGQKELNYVYDGMKLRIQLDQEYTRVDTYMVAIEYIAKPDELEQQGSSAIASAKGLYFINPDGSDPKTMPQIWTQGETESNSVWYPIIDKPNERITQELFITVDDKYTTLSNGTLVYSKDSKNGTRTDYWKQDLDHTPYLTMMTIGEFKRVEDKWIRPDGTEMMVDYYVEEDWVPYAKEIFGTTPEMIGFFSELLGTPYPWDKYSQIVVREYVSGAMENTSAVIHGDFLYRNTRELLDDHNESIIAHELFHHWFGDLVTCESWANLPLNESFANYSQFLWDEYKHGMDEAEYHAESEADGYFASAQQSGYVDMIRFDYLDKEEMFDGHSYNKGGRILHMLRNYLGDDAFFKSLQHYLNKMGSKPAEIHDLRLSFEEVTGEDLNWFFNQWFLDKGHPTLEIKQEMDSATNEMVVHVNQKQDFDDFPLYKIPFAIEVYYDGNKVREEVVIEEVNNSFRFPIKGGIKNIIVDADRVVLCDREEIKPLEQFHHQYYNAPKYMDRKEAILEAGRRKIENSHQLIEDALNDPFWALRSLAIDNAKWLRKAKEEVLKNKLIAMAKEDKNAKVRSKAVSFLAKFYSKDNDVKALFEEALKDSSYTVMSKALNGISKNDLDKAMKLSKQYEKEKSTTLRTAIAAIYVKDGAPEHNEFFINAIEEAGGFSKFGLVSTYGTYLKSQKPETVKKGLYIFEDIAKNSAAWYFKLGGYQGLITLEGHYKGRVYDLEAQISKLETADEDNTGKIAELQKELNEAKEMSELMTSKIKALKAEEKDKNILNMLSTY